MPLQELSIVSCASLHPDTPDAFAVVDRLKVVDLFKRMLHVFASFSLFIILSSLS